MQPKENIEEISALTEHMEWRTRVEAEDLTGAELQARAVRETSRTTSFNKTEPGSEIKEGLQFDSGIHYPTEVKL